MYFDLANILVFVALTIIGVGGLLALGRLIRPSIPEIAKDDPYECGEKPIGNAWIQFNFRFYLVALVFIIFEVEIAFMFPVAAVYRTWVESGRGALALVEVLVFVGDRQRGGHHSSCGQRVSRSACGELSSAPQCGEGARRVAASSVIRLGHGRHLRTDIVRCTK